MDLNLFTISNVQDIQKILNDNNIIDCDENDANKKDFKCKKENTFKNCCMDYKLKKTIEITGLRNKLYSLNNNILTLNNKLLEYKNNYTHIHLKYIRSEIEYEKLKQIKNSNIIDCQKLNIYENTCPVCLDEQLQNVIYLKCKHYICLECYNNIVYFEHYYKCVICRLKITENIYNNNLQLI